MRGMAIVPPQVLVVRDAIDHCMAYVRCIQRALEQLGQVTVTQPGAHHSAVLRFAERRADTDADGLNAVAIEIEAGHIFAVRLGQTVVAVRATRGVCIQLMALFVEADHMIGTGENYSFYLVTTCGLIDVEYAADIGAKYVLEGA